MNAVSALVQPPAPILEIPTIWSVCRSAAAGSDARALLRPAGLAGAGHGACGRTALLLAVRSLHTGVLTASGPPQMIPTTLRYAVRGMGTALDPTCASVDVSARGEFGGAMAPLAAPAPLATARCASTQWLLLPATPSAPRGAPAGPAAVDGAAAAGAAHRGHAAASGLQRTVRRRRGRRGRRGLPFSQGFA